MSTPSPLVPQGSIQDAPKGRRNLPVLVFSVIGFHVAVLGVALMIGCKPETTKTADPLAQFSETNAAAPLVTDTSATKGNAAPITNPYELPPAPMPAPGTALGGTPAPAPGYGTVPPPIGATPVPAPTPTPTPTPGGYGAPGSFVDPLTPAVEPASSSTTEHKVKSGDTFGKMAKEYGVSSKAIISANPNLDPRRLKVGQSVLIPAPSKATGAPSAPSASARSAGSATTGTYVVKSGDSLTRIAAKHGTSVKALKSLNGLKTDRVNVGQKLKVPVKSAPEPAPASAPAPELPISPSFGTSPSTVPVPQPVR
jgi:LysM repeat protein